MQQPDEIAEQDGAETGKDAQSQRQEGQVRQAQPARVLVLSAGGRHIGRYASAGTSRPHVHGCQRSVLRSARGCDDCGISCSCD